ncbi:MAG: FAD-dependent oxidoreductase [Pseudomonadota bacterium]
MLNTDILVSGGGIAGLSAAAGLAQAGLDVVVVDPKPASGTDDLRSTAYLTPGRMFLQDLGLWDEVAAGAAPLQALRVVDTKGTPPRISADRTFEAADMGLDAFGWNLPNTPVRTAMLGALEASPRVTMLLGTGVADMTLRESGAIVRLGDGTRIKARLVVGADGRDSPVRQLAGIEAKTVRYGQKAIAAVLAHARPHDAISTEVYASGGAFTLVPLPDRDAEHRSALVWMEDGANAQALAAMDDDGFGVAATQRSAGVLGPLTLRSRRQIWPIVTRTANQLTAQRVALVAEAAHVLPPIGAQGLNTSLGDIRALIDAAKAEAPGSPAMLARYAEARQRDIHLRAKAIDAYNRLCRSSNPVARGVRAAGLKAAHDLTPLRNTLMRAGLGS